MWALGVTIASVAARLVVGGVKVATQTVDHETKETLWNALKDSGPAQGLTPRLPFGTATLGAITGAIGFGIHATPNRNDCGAEKQRDGHNLENRFHRQALHDPNANRSERAGSAYRMNMGTIGAAVKNGGMSSPVAAAPGLDQERTGSTAFELSFVDSQQQMARVAVSVQFHALRLILTLRACLLAFLAAPRGDWLLQNGSRPGACVSASERSFAPC